MNVQLNSNLLIINEIPIDPKITEKIIGKRIFTREHCTFETSHSDSNPPIIKFIIDISSGYLNLKGFNHIKNTWYMDIIRYNLNGESCSSCNLNYKEENLIIILFCLRNDSRIKGNLKYKDINNFEKTLIIENTITIIINTKLGCKLENCSGTGIRDIIVISFQKN